MSIPYDVCIRGGGIVGRTLALLLAAARLRVALVEAPAARASGTPDVRAYALNAQSRDLLDSVRCWPAPEHATPVLGMQIEGDAGGRVSFAAQALGAPALTWIVDVPALEQTLAQAIRFQPLIECLDRAPAAATLTVICEGRDSPTRQHLGVPYDSQAYPQHALATRLRAEQPHAQIARQWFAPDQILALLPLGGGAGHELAVVWTLPSAQAPHWQQAEPEAVAQALETLSGHALGRLELSGARACWPLHQAQARRWTGQTEEAGQTLHWVLAGDAAHTVHPLAGQGLNLGLGDVAELARVLRERPYWRSLADPKVLRPYERARRAACAGMGLAMDGLQCLFMHSASGVQSLRNWGMDRFEESTALKRWLARQAMGQAPQAS